MNIQYKNTLKWLLVASKTSTCLIQCGYIKNVWRLPMCHVKKDLPPAMCNIRPWKRMSVWLVQCNNIWKWLKTNLPAANFYVLKDDDHDR